MKALFAVDGSCEALDAARSACRFLQVREMQAELVCVAPDYLPAMTGWEEGKLRERYRRRILRETHRILSLAKAI